MKPNLSEAVVIVKDQVRGDIVVEPTGNGGYAVVIEILDRKSWEVADTFDSLTDAMFFVASFIEWHARHEAYE